MDKVELQITGLSYSQSQTEAYALILTESGVGKRNLPVIIGKNEAQAIAIYMENMESPRPLTHDLVKIITKTLQGDIVEVNIVKLVAGIFYAEICLMKDAHVFRIDTRVSDAIALALRFQIPVYCDEKVMEAASFVMEDEDEDTEIIEESKASGDFGGYTLKQLEMMMNEAVRDEDYERAARLKNEIEKKLNKS